MSIVSDLSLGVVFWITEEEVLEHQNYFVYFSMNGQRSFMWCCGGDF